MKLFKNIDWERVKIEFFSLKYAYVLVCSVPPYFYIVLSSDARIEYAMADSIIGLIIPVMCIWFFIKYITTDEKFKKKGRVKRRSDERDGKIEISVERFKTLVEALEALPEDIKGDSADMVIRGLTGLISNVANDIPELKKYFFATNWKWAICDFLECDFSMWAEHNPKIWGNDYGWHMFNSSKAFGKNHGDALTHDEIIIHLRDVYNRLEQSNTVKPAGKFRRLFFKQKGEMK